MTLQPTEKDTLWVTLDNTFGINLEEYAGNFLLMMMFNLKEDGLPDTTKEPHLVTTMPTYHTKQEQIAFNKVMFENNCEKLINLISTGLVYNLISMSNESDIPLADLMDSFIAKMENAKHIFSDVSSETLN